MGSAGARFPGAGALSRRRRAIAAPARYAGHWNSAEESCQSATILSLDAHTEHMYTFQKP